MNNNNNESLISEINNKFNNINFYFMTLLIIVGLAIQTAEARSFKATKDKTTAYIFLGQSNVKANELVIGQPPTYPVDYKLSQLIWDSKNIATIVAGLNFMFDKEYVFNIEGKFAVDEGKGVMDDYDWLDIGNDWSHWSHHEDTDITGLDSLDINVDYHLYGNNKSKLSLLIGYKDETWAWESRGGTYIYSTSGILRDDIGSFTAGQPVITYEQRFKMPYLGLRFQTQLSNWKFDLQYNYSNQVSVKSSDHHILRDLIFQDDFAKGEMSAYKVGIAYNITKNFDIHVRYDVQDYEEVRGNTIYIDSPTGIPFAYCLNCAGADNSNETWSAGVSFIY